MVSTAHETVQYRPCHVMPSQGMVYVVSQFHSTVSQDCRLNGLALGQVALWQPSCSSTESTSMSMSTSITIGFPPKKFCGRERARECMLRLLVWSRILEKKTGREGRAVRWP